MSTRDILLKQKVFPSRPQTQRKIKNKGKFIAVNNSGKKINGFRKSNHSQLPQSIKQLTSKNVQITISKNNLKEKIKSKLTFLQCQDQQILNFKKIQNCKIKKFSQHSQQILKVKKASNKPKKEKIYQIKRKSFSVLESKRQNKQKIKIQIEDKQKIYTSDKRRSLISLQDDDDRKTIKVCEKALNYQEALVKKGVNYGFQFLRELKRKEKSAKSKKSSIYKCKFVINPFQSIKLKKCISQLKNNHDWLTILHNENLSDFGCLQDLDDISEIPQVSLISRCSLQNQSVQILQMLNYVYE